MENNLLRDIIEVEKEIQKTLDLESERMRAWLENRKKELQEGLGRAEKDLAESFERSRERAVQEARDRAVDVEQQARRQADRLAGITNETLAGIVTHHIIKILPG